MPESEYGQSHRSEDAGTGPPGDRPRPLPVHVRRLLAFFLWAVALALVLYFFQTITFVFLLFLAAATLAAALAPLRDYLPGPRALRGVIVMIGFVLIVAGLLFLMGWLLKDPIQNQLQQWPQIKQTINSTLQSWSNKLGLQQKVTISQIMNRAYSMLAGGGGGNMLMAALSGLVAAAVGVALFIFGSLYMLAESPRRLISPLARLMPRHAGNLRRGIATLEMRLRWWLIGTLASMCIIGGITAAGFTAIGLKLALPLALLAGFAEIVPTLGPALAFAAAMAVAATQGFTQVAYVGALYLGVQMIESYIVLPLIMKEAVHLPPLVTLFTVVLWGGLFGPLGLLLALPLNLLIWTAVEYFYLTPRDSAERT